MKNRFLIFSFCTIIISCTNKQITHPSLDAFRDGIHHWNLEHKERNYERYTSAEYHEIANNLIAYQNEDGGWPKNIDWLDEDTRKRRTSYRI